MIAFMFPGQGSQNPGMGKDLADKFPAARQVFEEADEALGFALSDLCFNGPADELQLTENTQPAILTTSVAALRAMESEGFPKPDFVAGHSLGEYSALVAAGALSLTDAVRTVRKRGQYMQEAVPVGTAPWPRFSAPMLRRSPRLALRRARRGLQCRKHQFAEPDRDRGRRRGNRSRNRNRESARRKASGETQRERSFSLRA